MPNLIVRWPGGATNQHPLNKPQLRLGRAADNDVVVNHPAVSGHHLLIEVTPPGLSVTDLKSTNGTMINGQRIPPNTPQPFKQGDMIRVGDLTGNSVSMTLESDPNELLRTLSLGRLDLTGMASITIGRDPNSYLPLNHPTVSSHHAMIFKQGDILYIRDVGSTNGTFVNGQRISQVQLSSGDEIQIGPFKLIYDAQAQSLAQSMHLGHRLDALRLGRQVAKGRLILQDVTLSIQAGEFVSFVGGSGAGKSTLLKAMNGYEPANQGQILLDGEPFYPKLDLYRTQMGYVPQDDIIHRELPVRLALWYAAKLRLPDAKPMEIEARIQDALKAVDMVEHADKRVRVLSGGQRKRVSIAVELLARPSLFFLDEPTSGLDPGLEKKMMYDLNRLADEGKTVILVTHATSNIEQCDYVAFMSYGRLAFFGPPKDAITFFNAQDFADIYLRLSQVINPAAGAPPPAELAPYYQASAGKDGKVMAGTLWAEHYARSTLFQKYVVGRQGNLAQVKASAANAPPPKRSRDSAVRQMVILARRMFDLIRLDPRTLIILLVMMPFIGALFAMVSSSNQLVGPKQTAEQVDAKLKAKLVGKPVDTSAESIPYPDAKMLLVMVGLAMTQGGTFAAAYEIVKERAIFKRERAVNLSVVAYVTSKIFVLGVFGLFQVASLLLILAITVNLGVKGVVIKPGWLELGVSLYLGVLASITFGLFISSIVPSTDVVLYAILAQLFIQIILSGTLFPLPDNPASKATVGYWTMNALGSTVDLKKLDNEGRSCKVVEIPSMSGGSPTLEAQCSAAPAMKSEQDGMKNYKHTAGHLTAQWIGLLMHVLVWTVLTILFQARKKIE